MTNYNGLYKFFQINTIKIIENREEEGQALWACCQPAMSRLCFAGIRLNAVAGAEHDFVVQLFSHVRSVDFHDFLLQGDDFRVAEEFLAGKEPGGRIVLQGNDTPGRAAQDDNFRAQIQRLFHGFRPSLVPDSCRHLLFSLPVFYMRSDQNVNDNRFYRITTLIVQTNKMYFLLGPCVNCTGIISLLWFSISCYSFSTQNIHANNRGHRQRHGNKDDETGYQWYKNTRRARDGLAPLENPSKEHALV